MFSKHNVILQRGNIPFLLCAIFLVLLSVLFYASANPHFPCNGDSCHYIGAAKSLLGGDGYTFNGRPETLYPPGLSLAIAGIMHVFGEKYIYFSRYVAICSICFIVLTVLYYRLRGLKNGIVYCLIMASSPAYFRYATEVGSDIPFMLGAVGYIYLLELAHRRRNDHRRKYLSAVAAVVFLLYAISNRSVGMALVAATGVTLLQSWLVGRRDHPPRNADRPLVLFFLIGIAFYAYWSYWSSAHTIALYENEFHESYFRQFWLLDPHHPDRGTASLFLVFGRFIVNIPLQIAHIAEFFTNIGWIEPLWLSPATVFSIMILGMGFAHELRRSQPLAGWYALFYMLIILAWPYDEGRRFIFAILPILMILIVRGLFEAVRLYRGNPVSIRKYIVYISVTGLAGSIARMTFLQVYSRQEIFSILLWLLVIAALYFPYRRRHIPAQLKSASFALHSYAAFFLISSFFLIAANADTRASEQADCPLESVSQWILANTSASSVIMSSHNATLHFMTGRSVVPLPITGRKHILSASMNAHKPDYLIIDYTNRRFEYFRPVEEERFRILERLFPKRFAGVFSDRDMIVYRVSLQGVEKVSRSDR